MNGLQAQHPERMSDYIKSNTKKNLTAEVRNLQRQKRDLTELLKPKSNRSLRSATKATPKAKSKTKATKATPKASKSKTPSPKTKPTKTSPKKRTPKRKNSSSQSNWSS